MKEINVLDIDIDAFYNKVYMGKMTNVANINKKDDYLIKDTVIKIFKNIKIKKNTNIEIFENHDETFYYLNKIKENDNIINLYTIDAHSDFKNFPVEKKLNEKEYNKPNETDWITYAFHFGFIKNMFLLLNREDVDNTHDLNENYTIYQSGNKINFYSQPLKNFDNWPEYFDYIDIIKSSDWCNSNDNDVNFLIDIIKSGNKDEFNK